MNTPSTEIQPHHLFESIRLADGAVELLDYHQARMDRSRRMLYPRSPALRLADLLEELDLPRAGVHKLRITYGPGLITHRTEPYVARPVSSLRLLDANELHYRRKVEDRSTLRAHFDRRGGRDDVLLVQHGLLTDTSYANVALFDGNRWYTPAWPLLPGTRRAQLIAAGELTPALIRERDLPHFSKLRLINAMLEWGRGPEVRGEQITR